MSNPTTPFSWQMPTATDLVTDLPADFEVFGQAVATSMADLLGGTTGQILSKTTNADMDFTWTTPNPGDITGVTAGVGISGGGTSGDVTVTNSMATAIDAKGDLIAGTAADTFSRLAVGTNGQTLVADSSTATGLKWATASSSSGPAFRASRATTQSISANTTTKMEFNSETFDTDGCYDPTTNFRFTPTTAGYYNVGAMAYFYAASFGYGRIYIYKNGSNALETEQPPRTSGAASPAFTHLIAMNGSTDYLEVYVRMDAAGTVGDGIVANNFYAFWTRSL